MYEDENGKTLLERVRLGEVVVRRREELARIRVQDVEHVEISVVDAFEGHVGRVAFVCGWMRS